MKKMAIGLAIATFTMCNFATFLTRSGIFSSLHAFSQSSIGWLFLALMVLLSVAGGLLAISAPGGADRGNSISSLLSREAMIWLSTVALLLLAVATCLGTIFAALSEALVGHKIVVGPPFYNNVLVPIGLLVLVATALAPLLRWGRAPGKQASRDLGRGSVAGWPGHLPGFGADDGGRPACSGDRRDRDRRISHWSSWGGSLILDAQRRSPENSWLGLLRCLR